jgi:hypothetical protein
MAKFDWVFFLNRDLITMATHATPGTLEYKVIVFTGFTKDIAKVIGELDKEVTAKLNAGATLVGGVNIASLEQGGTYGTRVLVSQAITYYNVRTQGSI